MEKTIWKYEIPIRGKFYLLLPEGAEILAFFVQREQPCIWALVDPRALKKARYFQIVGTGHPFSDWEKCKHIGSVSMENGSLIWHLFEEFSV